MIHEPIDLAAATALVPDNGNAPLAAASLADMQAMLSLVASGIDARFVAAGEALARAYGVVERLIASLEGVSQALDGAAVSAAVTDMQAIADHLTCLPAMQQIRQAALATIGGAGNAVQKPLARFDRTLRFLRICGLNIKVAAAGADGFSGFADLMISRLDVAEAEMRGFADQIDSVERGVAAALQAEQRLVEESARVIPEVPRRLSRDALSLKAEQNKSRADADRIAGAASEIRSQIGIAIGALQIGDITRQRLEHIVTGFAGLLALGTRAPNDPVAGHIVALLATQAADTTEDFRRQAGLLAQTLQDLGPHAAALIALTGDSPHATEPGGSAPSPLELLEQSIDEVRSLAGRLQEANAISDRIGSTTLTTAEALAARLIVIQRVTLDVQQMAWNTDLRSRRLGDAGRGLGAVATEIRNFSLELESFSLDIASVSEQIATAAQAMHGAAGGVQIDVGHALDVALLCVREGGRVVREGLAGLDNEGGAIQLSTGVDYDMKRFDFDYGAKISDSVRFHFGGYYRTGEGPRAVGFNAYQGGQLKFNITKQFADGYIRLSAKYLDDRSPQYTPVPVRITGTNDKPVFNSFPNFDIGRDSVLSRYIPSLVALGVNNQPMATPLSDGMHAKVIAGGIEGQFDIAGWTLTERGRYAKISGGVSRNLVSSFSSGTALPASLGAGLGTLSYASGPATGQVISDRGAINGNGLFGNMLLANVQAHALDNFTNDFRANRSFKVGSGELTLTGGVYKSLQKLNTDWFYGAIAQDVVGGGNSSLINYTNAAGIAQTQDGFLNFSLAGGSGLYRRAYNVQYDVTAPYGSVNYHIGKLAIGASIREDIGKVRGQLFGADLGGGRVGNTAFDFNGDGLLSVAERKTATLPLTRPAPVSYGYNYLSYSVGANYRIAETLSGFARYSRGARANADKILFTNTVSTTDGSIGNAADAYDVVTQTEGGFKFRNDGLTANVTAFLADTEDTNLQSGAIQTQRNYRAYGAEFEAGFQRGPFSVTGGMTYTKAKIIDDSLNLTVAGKTPKHQPDLIFELTPQYDSRYVTVGANVVGTTGSFAQDSNLLRMPGYTVVNAFLQVRPVERLQVMLNVNNLFDTVGFFEISQASVPATGIGWGRSVNGRTISTSARFSF